MSKELLIIGMKVIVDNEEVKILDIVVEDGITYFKVSKFGFDRFITKDKIKTISN